MKKYHNGRHNRTLEGHARGFARRIMHMLSPDADNMAILLKGFELEGLKVDCGGQDIRELELGLTIVKVPPKKPPSREEMLAFWKEHHPEE